MPATTTPPARLRRNSLGDHDADHAVCFFSRSYPIPSSGIPNSESSMLETTLHPLSNSFVCCVRDLQYPEPCGVLSGTCRGTLPRTFQNLTQQHSGERNDLFRMFSLHLDSPKFSQAQLNTSIPYQRGLQPKTFPYQILSQKFPKKNNLCSLATIIQRSLENTAAVRLTTELIKEMNCICMLSKVYQSDPRTAWSALGGIDVMGYLETEDSQKYVMTQGAEICWEAKKLVCAHFVWDTCFNFHLYS